MDLPKYTKGQYVECQPNNGCDDFGVKLPSHNKGTLIGDVRATYQHQGLFIYCVSDHWSFREENISPFGNKKQEVCDERVEEITHIVYRHITSLLFEIKELKREIEKMKIGKQSKELEQSRKLIGELALALNYYKNSSKIDEDRNMDDCSGSFLCYGQKARTALGGYHIYCQDFGQIEEWELQRR